MKMLSMYVMRLNENRGQVETNRSSNQSPAASCAPLGEMTCTSIDLLSAFLPQIWACLVWAASVHTLPSQQWRLDWRDSADLWTPSEYRPRALPKVTRPREAGQGPWGVSRPPYRPQLQLRADPPTADAETSRPRGPRRQFRKEYFAGTDDVTRDTRRRRSRPAQQPEPQPAPWSWEALFWGRDGGLRWVTQSDRTRRTPPV